MAIVSRTTPAGNARKKYLHTRGACCHTNKPVTGLNEAATTLGDVLYKIEGAKLKQKAGRRAVRERTQRYLEAEHDFQLWRGETAFGKPQRMTGQEAYEKNRRYEKLFFANKDPSARLFRLMPVGSKPIAKGTTYNDYRKYKFTQSV